MKLLYSFLLVGTSGGVGLAVIVEWLNYKLYKLDQDRTRKSLGMLLLGIILQNGILTFALIDNGTAQLSGRALLYALGLAISTVGLGWKAGQFTSDLALVEAVSNGHNKSGAAWIRLMEERLSAEEKRNTGIEEAAEIAKKRADEAEKRESE